MGNKFPISWFEIVVLTLNDDDCLLQWHQSRAWEQLAGAAAVWLGVLAGRAVVADAFATAAATAWGASLPGVVYEVR